jgi:hypothetical protein
MQPIPPVIKELAFAILRFIHGVMLGYVRSSPTTHSAEQIDRLRGLVAENGRS